MAKGISIPIASETREFSAGIQSGVVGPLQDAVKTLDQVAQAGDAGAARLEAALRQQQEDTKNTGREYQRLSTTIDSAEHAGTQSIQLSAREQRRIRRETIKQAGEQAKQAVVSNLQSIDGSAQSFLGALTGTVTGVLSAFPGIGIAIGATVATATSVISGLIGRSTEKTKEFKAEVGALTKELVDTGAKGGPAISTVVDQLKQLAATTEDGKVNLKQLFDIANAAGQPFDKLAQAFAGNGDELDALILKNKTYLGSLEDQINVAQRAAVQDGTVIGPLSHKITAQTAYVTVLEDTKKKIDEAAKAQDIYVKSGAAELDRKAKLISQVNQAYDDGASSIDAYINKESGLFDVKNYIKAMQKREKALKAYQDTLATSGLSNEAKSFLESEGEQTAALQLDGYRRATPKQKAELERIWTEAGKTSSGAYASSFTGTLPATVKGPTVVVDTATAQKNIDKLGSNKKITVQVEGFLTRSGKRVF